MMIVPRAFMLLLALGAIATSSCDGCARVLGEGEGEGDDDDDDDGTPADPNVHALFVGVCNYIERCPSEAFAIGYRNVDECADILAFVFTCHIADVDDGTFGIDERPIDVSASEALACSAFLEEQPCPPPGSESPIAIEGPSPCDVLATGFADDAAGAGESCADESCATGLQCVTSSPEPDVCPVCLVKLGAGAPCSGSGIACAEGLVCGFDGVCTEPRADGASCLGADECQSALCSSDNVCISPRANGATCNGDFECASLFCRPDAGGGGASTCAIAIENGDACVVDDGCRNRVCDDATGVCGLPNASACSFSAQCASGYCDAGAGCVAPRALGGSCDIDEMCASGACDPDRRLCVLSCTADDDCDGNDRCDDGRCRTPLGDGSSCDFDTDCLSGFCSLFDEVCAPRPGPGSPCSGFDGCLRGDRCVNGTCEPKAGPGAACDGAFDACVDPWICIDGTCTLIDLQCRPAPPGARCTFLRLCDDTAYCDFGDDITCARRKALGEECFQDEECLSGLACAFDPTGQANPSCAQPAGDGASCASLSCAPGLFCDRDAGSVCTQLRSDGEPCDDDEECASGECFIDLCEPPPEQCTLP